MDGCQGCQIILGTTYQNGEKIYQITIKCSKWPQFIPNGHSWNQMTRIHIPNGHKIEQHLPLQKPSKIYPSCYFWLENMPSGNLVGCRWEKRNTLILNIAL
jgi:hypothetical protein